MRQYTFEDFLCDC